MAKKRKEKWQVRQLNKKISQYEAMSDDEFYEIAQKELAKGVAGSGFGLLLVVACIILMFIFM